MRGDLDNIVMMALRKEPERRYRSVEQFSEDIRRYLDDLPVTARADTFGYRLDKFIRRHKTGVAVLALLRKPLGAEHPWLAIGMHNLATLLRDKGDYKEAGALLREALAMQRKLMGDAHPEVGAGLHELAVLSYLEGKYAEAEQTERQAIDTYQKSYQPEHWRIHRSKVSLSACLIKLKRHHEAEEQLLAGYAGLKAALGEQHAETQKAVGVLSNFTKPGANPNRPILITRCLTPIPAKQKKTTVVKVTQVMRPNKLVKLKPVISSH